MEQYSSLLLDMGVDESLRNNIHHCCEAWGWTRVYGTIFISIVRHGGGREYTEQYSSLLLDMGVDESLRNNIHHSC